MRTVIIIEGFVYKPHLSPQKRIWWAEVKCGLGNILVYSLTKFDLGDMLVVDEIHHPNIRRTLWCPSDQVEAMEERIRS